MNFTEGEIKGVVFKDLRFFHDERGWLTELYRDDELPEGFSPVMAYVSLTRAGIARGPHEHRNQSDYFCFLGDFELYLWDNRPESPTYGNRMKVRVQGKVVLIPPGVVHAYRNCGQQDGLVINLPDRLYRGPGRKEEVDEIRYEDDPESPFRLE